MQDQSHVQKRMADEAKRIIEQARKKLSDEEASDQVHITGIIRRLTTPVNEATIWDSLASCSFTYPHTSSLCSTYKIPRLVFNYF